MDSSLWVVAGPFLIGFVMGGAGILRMLQRAGIEENGLAAKLLMTKEQRQAQQYKAFAAMFDPKYPIDRWLVFCGFGICALTPLCVIVLSQL